MLMLKGLKGKKPSKENICVFSFILLYGENRLLNIL